MKWVRFASEEFVVYWHASSLPTHFPSLTFEVSNFFILGLLTLLLRTKIVILFGIPSNKVFQNTTFACTLTSYNCDLRKIDWGFNAKLTEGILQLVYDRNELFHSFVAIHFGIIWFPMNYNMSFLYLFFFYSDSQLVICKIISQFALPFYFLHFSPLSTKPPFHPTDRSRGLVPNETSWRHLTQYETQTFVILHK